MIGFDAEAVRHEFGLAEDEVPVMLLSTGDTSLIGHVRNLIRLYEAREIVGFDRFVHVQAWLDRGLARRRCRTGWE